MAHRLEGWEMRLIPHDLPASSASNISQGSCEGSAMALCCTLFSAYLVLTSRIHANKLEAFSWRFKSGGYIGWDMHHCSVTTMTRTKTK